MQSFPIVVVHSFGSFYLQSIRSHWDRAVASQSECDQTTSPQSSAFCQCEDWMKGLNSGATFKFEPSLSHQQCCGGEGHVQPMARSTRSLVQSLRTLSSIISLVPCVLRTLQQCQDGGRRKRDSHDEAQEAARACTLVHVGEPSSARQVCEGAHLAPGTLRTPRELPDMFSDPSKCLT